MTTMGGIPSETPPSLYYQLDSDEEDSEFNDDQGSDVKAFNYYFLLLAILVLLVVGFLWVIHRWRKRQRDHLRQTGQAALARDLEGWQNAHRLMHGRYRANGAVTVQRDEGLDEVTIRGKM